MIQLIKIKSSDSQFGPSFDGKKGPTVFYNILSNEKYVGEIEFEPKQSEILSIYIDTSFRGKGIGREVINQLFKLHKIDRIIAWAAKSSIPFWKKVATKRLKNNYFVIEIKK